MTTTKYIYLLAIYTASQSPLLNVSQPQTHFSKIHEVFWQSTHRPSSYYNINILAIKKPLTTFVNDGSSPLSANNGSYIKMYAVVFNNSIL
jgi:hypothetical protein